MINKQDELYYITEKILDMLTTDTSELINVIKRCILTRTSCTKLQMFSIRGLQRFVIAFKVELIESKDSADGFDLIFSLELIQKEKRNLIVSMNEEIFDKLHSVTFDATKRIVELLEAEDV